MISIAARLLRPDVVDAVPVLGPALRIAIAPPIKAIVAKKLNNFFINSAFFPYSWVTSSARLIALLDCFIPGAECYPVLRTHFND